MSSDSNDLFKIFRVLWFPMSLNAVFLAACAVLLFYLGTWLASLVLVDSSLGSHATRAFYGASEELVTRGMWPGFGTDDKGNHHLAGSDSRHERTRRERDLAQLERLLGPWLRERQESIAAIKDEKERKSAQESFVETRKSVPSRYRYLFAWQLVLFFGLWSTFGVAICRVLALRVARDEYCTLPGAWRFAWRVKVTGLVYPLAVLLPIIVLAFCNAMAGLIAQIPYLGWLLGVLLIPLVIISCLLMILIGVAAVISLGFMPAAIATERKGTYDSLGKSFNYIFARPLSLILYLVILGTFLNLLHKLLIDLGLVESLMAHTLVPFWSNPDFELMAIGETSSLSGFQWFCACLYWVMMTLYHLLVWGALISYALGAFTSMFLVFRRDVEGMDYADVARDPNDAPPPAPVSEIPAAT